MKAAIFKDPFKPIKMEYHKDFFYHSVDLSLAMSTSRGYGSSHESFKQTFGQNAAINFMKGNRPKSKVQTELARTPKMLLLTKRLFTFNKPTATPSERSKYKTAPAIVPFQFRTHSGSGHTTST